MMKKIKLAALLAAVTITASNTVFLTFAAGDWVKENGSWYYYGEDGQRQTGWVEDNQKWYYLEEAGQMVQGTVREIDGKAYEFDSSGAWKEDNQGNKSTGKAQTGTWINDTTFSNQWSGYQLVFPKGYTNEAYDGAAADIKDFSVCSPEGDIMLQAVYRDAGREADHEAVNRQMEAYKAALTSQEGYTFTGVGQVRLGNSDYSKGSFAMGDSLVKEVYMRPAGNYILILEVLFCKGKEALVNQILGVE